MHFIENLMLILPQNKTDMEVGKSRYDIGVVQVHIVNVAKMYIV